MVPSDVHETSRNFVEVSVPFGLFCCHYVPGHKLLSPYSFKQCPYCALQSKYHLHTLKVGNLT